MNFLRGTRIVPKLGRSTMKKHEKESTPYSDLLCKKVTVEVTNSDNVNAVSYTHLDVYKRQTYHYLVEFVVKLVTTTFVSNS